ncbi:MAG: GNAT family N-acetyltransferase [Longimicrobiales bacterium]
MSGPGVRARTYSPDDRQACLAVFDTNVPGSFVAAEREQFEEFLDELPGPYLVLEDETGRVTACGGYAIAPGSTTADLCWGMVARDRQGTGLGRMLVEIRVALCCRDSSVIDAALKTSQHTRLFYEKLGFRTERVVPNGIAPGLDSCEMRMFIVRGQFPDNRPGDS